MQNITISTDNSLLDVPLIHHFLTTGSYWAKGIPLITVERSIQYSLCFGMYENNRQFGFARAITDRATYAYLADIFILPAYRNKGYSKMLMKFILDYPELQGLRRWGLATADAHSLYHQFGFTELSEPERMMESESYS
jgi:GNAT superfamily N-acetyltransferase